MCPPDRLNDDEMELWLKAGYQHVKGALKPQPISRPQFTLSELKNAIPAHCFERSMVKSFGYLALDLVIIISLLCCAYTVIECHYLPFYGQVIAYPLYWYIQGSFLFAIWVLAHECGECKCYEKVFTNRFFYKCILTNCRPWCIFGKQSSERHCWFSYTFNIVNTIPQLENIASQTSFKHGQLRKRWSVCSVHRKRNKITAVRYSER